MGQSQFKPKHKAVGRTFNGRKNIELMYDHTWKQYRLKFLAQNPECYACGKPATVVDHLIPHKGREYFFKKLDNHIPLCEVCHNTVTSLFDVKYKLGDKIEEKIKWLSSRRTPTENWTPKRIKVLPKYGG